MPPSRRTPAKNPAWARDELILALDLYLRLPQSQISSTHPEVIALSKVLRGLPLFATEDRPDPVRFRNPNGVAMKLRNFQRFDPKSTGVGLTAGGKLEENVWQEFAGDPDRLRRVADGIRIAASVLKPPSDDPPDTDGPQEWPEGRLIMRMHRYRERNRAATQAKKKQAKQAGLDTTCEACGTNFAFIYRQAGTCVLECHHLKPVSQMRPDEKTQACDLALVCANCHRVLHHGGETMSLSDLRSLLP